ncbi:hypothetical protein FRB90_002336 [Tulasnella sp. 427]|nr:hypothetical protein FRB90_002336 [Tulasnella sp. 427]
MASVLLHPPSLSLPTKILSGGLEIVDNQLEKASLYAEHLNHAIRPVPKQTEIIDYLDNPDLRLSHGARLVEGLRQQIHKGLPVTLSSQNAIAIVDALLSDFTGGMDDRKMLLEYVLTFLSRLPPTSLIGKTLNDKVITLLYNDLPHPPASLVGSKYRFRSADGSGNNLYKPEMGKAGSHYARSVQGVHPLSPKELPSPSLIFDALLKRETQEEHPSGLSSHFFAFANLVIHSLFHTDHSQGDEAINKTSSYLDLSIIYGDNQEQQDSIRLGDGTGRIKPDTFADARLLQMPPSTPALCVLFSRNHNHIAKKLLAINEQGRWTPKLDELDSDAKKLQDEEIFQICRLINCGWFMNTILSDYLAAILGLVREGNSWSLDPLQTYRDPDHKVSERGQGNVVSIEFTALYHFHASISAGDEQWAEDTIRRMFPGKSFDDISAEDYTEKIKKFAARTLTPPESWSFGGLTRQSDGSFPDAGLAKILQNATLMPAGAFGARRTPHVLKIVEVMSIEHNREWGTCTLNAFRSFLGLKPYETFDEWNPNPRIADAARRLYGHPDNLELYVGLQAEDTKPPIPGAGLCPGYTTSRAILADAVALVRGDRYLTNDYTAYNLTSWGIVDAERDPKNAAFGGKLGSLLMRTLPDHYDPKSVYTQFPFMTPFAMQKYLTDLGLAGKYSFDKPIPLSPLRAIKSASDVRAALKNPDLHSIVPSLARDVFPGLNYLSTFNRPELHHEYQTALHEAFAGNTRLIHTKFLSKLSAQLIREKSYTVPELGTTFVDIVKDVIQPLGAHFAASFVLGVPVKSHVHPHGIYYPGQLLQKLRSVYDYIFSLTPSTNAISVLDEARKVVSELGRHIPFANLYDKAVHIITGSPHESHNFLGRLLKRRTDREDLAFDAVVLAALLAVELPKAITNVVDVLLSDAFLPNVLHLAASGTNASLSTLKAVVLEAIRLAPPVAGVIREAVKETLINGKPVNKGNSLFLSLVDAAYDPCFKNPDHIIVPSRGVDLVNDGLSRLLGSEWIADAALPVIKNIFNIGGLGRSPGGLGHLSGLKDELPGGTKFRQFIDYSQHITNFPSKLLLSYTGKPPGGAPVPVSTRPTAPTPTNWDPTANSSNTSESSQGTSQGGSGTLDGDSKAPSAGGTQVVPSIDYKPEFVGGVGGGANDPDYDYQNPSEDLSGPSGGGSIDDNADRVIIWRPELDDRQDSTKTSTQEGSSVKPDASSTDGPSVKPNDQDKTKDPDVSTSDPQDTSNDKAGGTASGGKGHEGAPTNSTESAASGGSKDVSDPAPTEGSEKSPHVPQPGSSTADQGSADQTPPQPQNEPSGFSHADPAGDLRKGTGWDDYTVPPDPLQATITVIKVCHDAEGIRSIQVTYGGKTAPRHGASSIGGIREDSLYLQRGEKITRVEGREGDKILTSLQLFTSTGRQSSLFGSSTVGKPFVRSGNVLRYFSGNETDAGITALRGHFTVAVLSTCEVEFCCELVKASTTMNNGVSGVNNLNRDLVNVFQQGGYASTGQMHALQQQRFLQQQQQHHQQQMTAASQLGVPDPGSASNPLLDGQIANPLDNFGGSSGGLSFSLDPANAAKQMAALQAAGRSRALSHSASGTTSSQFPTPLNPAVAGLQPGGGNTTTTATPGINPPPAMDPQMQNMQQRQLHNAQAMILNAMLNNRPPNFLPQLAEVMAARGTPLPQTITGVPSPTYDPASSSMRTIAPGSSPGTIQFAGKEMDLHMLMIWVIQRGGFHKIQLDEAAWESFLSHIGLPRRQPSPNPSQPPIDLVQILQRHYFILLFPFEPQWTKVVQQKVMLTMRQQQHVALQQAMAANGGQALNPALVNSNLHGFPNGANPQLGLQTPGQTGLPQQPAFAQQQNLLAQQQARTQLQQQLMAQQQPSSNILAQQQQGFQTPNVTGPQALSQQPNPVAGMPQSMPDVTSMGHTGLTQSPVTGPPNGLDNAPTPDVNAQMGDSDSEARKRKRTDTGDVDGKRPRLDEYPAVADGTPNGMPDAAAVSSSSNSPTRPLAINGHPQVSQQPSGPRMRIQYRPLFRQINSYGGRNLPAIERERAVALSRRTVRPIEEWGEVDIDGLIMSLRSRTAVEVTYALTALLALSTAGRRQEEGFILTPCADDLIPVLLELLKETAFGSADADEAAQPSDSPSPPHAAKQWTHQELMKLALEDGSEIFGPGFAFSTPAGERRRDGRRCADPERGPKERQADVALIVTQLFRNLSLFPANAEIFVKYPTITDTIVRMCCLEDESTAPPASFPEPLAPAFTLTDLIKMQDHALNYLANMSQFLDFEDLLPQTPPRIFRLASRYIISPSIAVSPYLASGPLNPQQPPPLPPSAPDLALDMFSRISHRDEHRRVFAQRVQSQEIFNFYSALVRMLPVGREDYHIMTVNQHSLEAWVGYAERIMLSIYSLVFLASPSLKRKMKHPGVTSVITRLSYFYMKCVTPEGKAFASAPAPNTSHPFMVISRRAIETLKLLDQEGDCFGDESSVSMTGPFGFPTFGIGYGEPDAMGTKAREEGVGILAGNWEQVVLRMMQCPGVDDEFFAEMDSLVRMGNAYEALRLPVGIQA